jgi:hypothetical protein
MRLDLAYKTFRLRLRILSRRTAKRTTGAQRDFSSSAATLGLMNRAASVSWAGAADTTNQEEGDRKPMSEIDYFDLESVKRHFETLTTHQERILFCQEVIDYLKTDPDAVYDHSIWDYAGGNYDPRLLLTSKQRKADEVLEFAGLMKERSERVIEREAQTGQSVQNDGPDDPAPWKWTNIAATYCHVSSCRPN